MRICLLTLCVFSLCLAMPLSAHSREPGYEGYTADKLNNTYLYKKWLIRAKQYANGRKGTFPFYTLLSAYVKGENYDPYGQKTMEKLYEYAYQSDISGMMDDGALAVLKFHELLEEHLANYTIVSAAIPLVEQNAKLGDVKFLRWMQNGLALRALNSGTGNVARDAYQVYSIGEEALILKNRRAKILGTEILQDDNQYFHMHLAEDPRSGKPFKIYILLSAVMQNLKSERAWQNPARRPSLLE